MISYINLSRWQAEIEVTLHSQLDEWCENVSTRDAPYSRVSSSSGGDAGVHLFSGEIDVISQKKL